MITGNFLQIPETGDKGSVFFPALAANFLKLDTHTHNGVDSPALSSSAVTALTGPDLLPGAWASLGDGSGRYQQLVTMPSGLTIGPYIPSFKLSGGANDLQPMHPEVIRNTDFSFYVRVNDPTITLKVFYTT